MTTTTTVREAIQAVRHDIPEPSAAELSVDEARSDVIFTVTVGKLVGKLVRHALHYPEGVVTFDYDVQINGIDDVGAGIAELHLENRRAMCDLSQGRIRLF